MCVRLKVERPIKRRKSAVIEEVRVRLVISDYRIRWAEMPHV